MGAPLSLYHVRAKISEGNYRSAIFPSLLSPRNRIFAANFSFGRASIDLIKYFARAEVIALRFIVSSNPTPFSIIGKCRTVCRRVSIGIAWTFVSSRRFQRLGRHRRSSSLLREILFRLNAPNAVRERQINCTFRLSFSEKTIINQITFSSSQLSTQSTPLLW